MRIAPLLLAGLALGSSARAATSLSFLTIDCDAASAATGEAIRPWGSALSSLSNPALAAPDAFTHFSISQSHWIFDSQLTALALHTPLVGPLQGGLDLRVLASEDFERRDDANPEPIGEFRLDDLAAGFSLSSALPGGLRAGLALRRVQEKLDNEDSRGWAGDVGLTWERDGLLVALGAANLGHSSAFRSASVKLPRTVNAGLSWSGPMPISQWPCTASATVRHLQDDQAHPHLGIELRPAAGLALRGGWVGGYDERGLTLGAGFGWKQLRLDYGWLPFNSALDDIHRFTFSFAL